MIIQKLATGATVATLLAASAMPAFAGNWGRHSGGNETKVEQSNFAAVGNFVNAESNTGDNEIEAEGGKSRGRSHHRGSNGGDAEDNKIKTGDAKTGVLVATVANSNDAQVDSCGCESRRGKKGDKEIKVEQGNAALVLNAVNAESNSGDNEIEAEGGDAEDNKIKTGDASTGVAVVNVLNSNVAQVN